MGRHDDGLWQALARIRGPFMVTKANVHHSYRRPPVIEALCELFFDSGEWDETVPGRLYDRISKNYPRKRTLQTVTADITLTAEEARAGVRKAGSRVQFLSADEKQIVQVQRDLLVVNQLAPYPEEGFEAWKPAVLEQLSNYKALCSPRAIKRMGVRYLNRITISETEFQLEESFATYPQLPPDSPAPQSDFLMRVEVPEPDGKRRLLVTFSSAPDAHVRSASFVLDLYYLSDVLLADPFADLPDELTRAHGALHAMFEKSITSRTRELFGPVEDQR